MSGTIFDPERVTTTQDFTPNGLSFHSGSGKGFVYVQADGAISVGAVCTIKRAGQADELDAGNVATNNGLQLGVAQVAIADDSWGWLQVFGVCDAIQVAGAVSIGDYLWATTTDGALDDADVANANIRGISVNARSSAGNTPGILTFPTIGGNE